MCPGLRGGKCGAPSQTPPPHQAPGIQILSLRVFQMLLKRFLRPEKFLSTPKYEKKKTL